MAARRRPAPSQAVQEARRALEATSRLVAAPFADPATLLALRAALGHALGSARAGREGGPSDPRVEVEAREALRALLMALRSGSEAALAALEAPPPRPEGPLVEVTVQGAPNPDAPPMVNLRSPARPKRKSSRRSSPRRA